MLVHLPRAIEEFVFPKLEIERDQSLSFVELERKIASNWKCDLVEAARLVAAVGFTTSERVPHEIMRAVRAVLPRSLQNLFQDKQAKAA